MVSFGEDLIVDVRTGRVYLPPRSAEGIFHYTGIDSLIGIIENRELWLSSSRTVNDTHEGLWLKSRLSALLNDEGWDPWLREHWDTLFSASEVSFLACFSSRRDMLSQWRAYAADGTGVAVEFDPIGLPLATGLPSVVLDPPSLISSDPRFVLQSVHYLNDEEIRELFLDQLHIAVAERDDGADFRLRNALTQLSLVIKNPAFTEEDEIRVFHTPDESQDLPGIRFRQASGRLVSYVKLRFYDAGIRSIMLGPQCRVDKSELRRLLDHEGMHHVTVERSRATYRS